MIKLTGNRAMYVVNKFFVMETTEIKKYLNRTGICLTCIDRTTCPMLFTNNELYELWKIHPPEIVNNETEWCPMYIDTEPLV